MRNQLVDWKAWENHNYNPETARDYRNNFQKRDALGRNWAQRVKDARDADPTRKERNRRDVARHRFIAKRNLKELLISAGASPEAARRFLKPLSLEQICHLARFLAARDNTRPLSPGALLKLLHSKDSTYESRASSEKVNVTTVDATPLSP